MSEKFAGYGWRSNFETFSGVEPSLVRDHIREFVRDASSQQVRAWDDSLRELKREIREILSTTNTATHYETILEYELPMETRRTDAIFLISGSVIVLEFKGKVYPSQADIDQAQAYRRDLKAYHQDCWETPVEVAVVAMRGNGFIDETQGVRIFGPDYIDSFVGQIDRPNDNEPITSDQFLRPEAYCPQPTLIQAARELMKSGNIRAIHRARAATEPALQYISDVIHEAARTKSRRLVLLTGVPGSGKTLVGLQIVHADFLDDLAIPRENGNLNVPAVFLSGNGPLVEVLQYELSSSGGGGRTFVRGVKDYVKRYSANSQLVPPEHVLVFDEAQRAFDAEQVRAKHSNTPGFQSGKSEPEHFIEFAERIPEWCVVVGLIGGGQEIHIGEEAGVIQWLHAIENSPKGKEWTIHIPPGLEPTFRNTSLPVKTSSPLDLDVELRFHLAEDLHKFVRGLLENPEPDKLLALANKLEANGYHLRISRDLEIAKSYLRERYAEDPEARFGIVASSKDKDLVRFGIDNDFQSTKNVRKGPWYGDAEDSPSGRSCRLLKDCMTEFGAQGLELDAVLLAWGTDFKRENGKWTNSKARGYKDAHRIKDSFQLRVNAYRVLLTRGRDVTVVYVPALKELDETYSYLKSCGFHELF